MVTKQDQITLMLGSYERIQAFFECGCGFYNDEWRLNEDVIGICPTHNAKILSISGALVAGDRPSSGALTKIDRNTGLQGIAQNE